MFLKSISVSSCVVSSAPTLVGLLAMGKVLGRAELKGISTLFYCEPQAGL